MSGIKQTLAAMAVLGSFALASSAHAFDVNVVDQDGIPVSGFKYLVEEDNTHAPQPGVHVPGDPSDVTNNTLSVSIHKSYAPVVARGESTNNSATIDGVQFPDGIGCAPSGPGCEALPAGRYFVSVLPFGDASSCSGTFDMGGGPIDTSTENAVTVQVRRNPIETAQISVKVFHDIAPLNNAPDVTEIDPPNGQVQTVEGFTVTLTDQGGDIVQDAFGNKLGTTYQTNPDGSYVVGADCAPIVATVGSGDFETPPNGEVIIKNLAPNKYGVQIEPPGPDCITNPNTCWRQTTTIEGTQTIDAWVRPNEPPFLVEFGPPFWHAFYGFVKPLNNLPGGGGTTITGQVRKAHLSRPPQIAFNNGPPPEGEAVGERCIVGLNTLEQGQAEAVWIGLCQDETGNFTTPAVPPGTYQLVIWDISLLHIISFNTVITADSGGSINLGTIPTPMWFGQQEHYVYFDANGNGMKDPTETTGIPEQNVNLRFRDGTIYQAFPTDTTGFVPFQSVFPFFHWQVAEVDFARLKATGLRVTNDDGGAVTNDDDGEGKRNPIVDEQTGPVLTQAYQVFAGQNQRYEWLKTNYTAGQNGGISGIVFYATTRAEDDPRLAAGEPWEPGVPRVQVNLYQDTICNSNGGPAIFPICPEAIAGEVGDGMPDDQNGNGVVDLADVDNTPVGWSDGGTIGPEDVDHNGNGTFDQGDALRVTYTDSWDDSLPEDCNSIDPVDPLNIHGVDVPLSQCAEGLRTWNQARPGVFDGGYAFGPNVTGDGSDEIPAGTYIVEAVTPPGYKLVKEEDRNVDFGPTPIPAILPARCVGNDHVVPPYMSFVTDEAGDLLPGIVGADFEAPFAGDTRSLCDRKRVDLGQGQNAAADFFLFTDVPKAARAVGLITDDFANELAPGKPSFTEKFSPPWISIAVFDYTGQEIFRTYGDEFGAYNWMAPSTYAINLPTPSGVGPKMNHFCLNHPGPIEDPNNPGTFITDPRFRPQYSTTCYTFNFEPGRTTYLDTPVIRQAAFVGALQTTLDCELTDGTPLVREVMGDMGPATIQGAGSEFTITSVGEVMVPNPAFPGGTLGMPDDPPSEDEFIPRNYGFGNTRGQVWVGDYRFPNNRIVSWGDTSITVRVRPADLQPGRLQTGQLEVRKRGSEGGQISPYAVTLNVLQNEPSSVAVHHVMPDESIQAAIDAADVNDLILIYPGVYRELPILYKRVRLQGAGAWSTQLVASHFSAGPGFVNPVVNWRAKLDELVTAGQIGLLPEQDPNTPDFFLKDGEAPGIFVSPNPTLPDGDFSVGAVARIDGLQINQADLGGAIYVNAYADRLQISNMRLIQNAGNVAGGVRVGNPTLVAFARGSVAVETSPNPGVNIHHNHILENGSRLMGGGISVFKGADGYAIEHNNMCGNFARSGGGAIAHRGLSHPARIEYNDIVFNEVFQGDQPGAGLGVGGGGGGIEIAGDPDQAGGLTEGTGDVIINANLIQGNLGGAADGGGIALNNVNGDDVSTTPWFVRITNNMIVNNVSGLGGAGLSMQDAVDVAITHNTIARNDSTATSTFAFEAGPAGPTIAQPAGIVSRAHSNGLLAALGGGATPFSNAGVTQNILWQNRSFFWDQNSAPDLVPVVLNYWDLGVTGVEGQACLSPGRNALTSLSIAADPEGCIYHPSNQVLTPHPRFVSPYFNDLTTAAAADEGGNFIQVYYTPLGVTGNYHLRRASPAIDPAINIGVAPPVGRLVTDFDGHDRPAPSTNIRDFGADEHHNPPTP